jgi:hypothetical protein
MRAVRVNPHAPVVDGHLNDPVWQQAEFTGGFAQKDPDEGAEPANRSEVAIVYDDDAIYIGARLFSADPDRILATVSRRDNGGNSERVIVSIDTYHDRRTAYSFAITASGTRIDYYHPVDTEYDRDYDFDPVWQGRAARTGDGWSAEMRIPFSQLRFRSEDEQVWGVNMNRWVPTTNEDSYWIVVPKDAQGWASRMGELTGIEGVKPSRRIELLPYAASDLTRRGEVDPDDPFAEENHYDARAGGDFKMGVGPNLTLEGTVNPDFGQVEADPAEVNLSAFETFFDERRPFFTEGGSLLGGGGSGYFYSRRIGSSPHGRPQGDYADVPHNTSILGAAKLTGRLNSGLSVGVLGALTEEEHADVFDVSTARTSRVAVEPRTGFGVLRLQQEFGASRSTAGMILTGMGRDFSAGGDLDLILAERAVTGGADWNLRFRGGDYYFSGSAGGSRIEGTPEAITAQQTSSRRYYQRPDAGHVDLDTTRTSLSGWVTRGEIAKNAGKWLWESGYGVESPGLELNDAGQLGTADDAEGWVGGRYRQNQQGARLQNWWAGAWVGGGWNNDGERQFAFFDYESSVTFRNYYNLWWGTEFFPGSQSDNLTRGGPSMATPVDWNVAASFSSNHQGRVSYSLYTQYYADDISGWAWRVEPGTTYRSGARWELSLAPRFYRVVNTRQYFDVFAGTGTPDTYGDRYVFATVDRTDLVVQTRLNFAFTPDLTLEFYAEPFAASGRYYDHGHLVAARANDLLVYGRDGTTVTLGDDGSRTVVDGAETLVLDNRDFNFVSFRSNLVLRWEWSPGSTLYLVWQQNRSDFDATGQRVGASDLWDALGAGGDHFFALKIAYWIPLL